MWGLINGAFMMLESYRIINTEKWLKPFRHIYALFVTVLAFVFFRADNLSSAFEFIKHMFYGLGNSESTAMFMSQITPMYLIMLILAIVFSMPVMHNIRKKAGIKRKVKTYEACTYVISLVLLGLCIITLSSASYNPFIYFRF